MQSANGRTAGKQAATTNRRSDNLASHITMSTARNFSPIPHPTAAPQPGEIWQIRDGAIVMIVRETTPTSHAVPPELPQAISVMLLSRETAFLSDYDVLVPQRQSGFDQDILAQTWQVFPMLRWDLEQFTGMRLTRAIYDGLLDIGDRALGLARPSIPQPHDPGELGLVVGASGTHKAAAIQAFHTQQRQIAARLTLALQQAEHQFHATQAMTQVVDIAAQQTRDLTEASLTDKSRSIGNVQTHLTQLSDWLTTEISNTITAGWAALKQSYQVPQLATALRSTSNPPERHTIEQWITQVNRADNRTEQRQAAINLGERLPITHPLKDAAIAALTAGIQTSTDNELLWTAVEGLWKLDPGNPIAGIQRVKPIDLARPGSPAAIDLIMAIVPQADQMALRFQVYATAAPHYLPANLRVNLLDESGQVLRQITTRPSDIGIQLKFTGQTGERFSVQVALDDAAVTEHFAI